MGEEKKGLKIWGWALIIVPVIFMIMAKLTCWDCDPIWGWWIAGIISVIVGWIMVANAKQDQ